MPRMVGIVVAVLLVIGSYVSLALTVIPAIITQLTNLVNSTIKAYPAVQEWAENLAHSDQFRQIAARIDLQSLISNLNVSYTDLLQNLVSGVSLSLGSVIGLVIDFVFILILVPTFLYYLLKDGHKILPFLKENVLGEDKYDITSLLSAMNATMSKYIFGLAVNVLFVFVALMVGYLIIGVPYAFLFALFGAIMTLIPYIGPYVGLVPVVLATAFTHPWLALIAVIYTLVVQQINGSFVFPKIAGEALHVHPVTVIVLMLVMGSLYGIIGMIIAVPLYALIKEIVKFIVGLRRNMRARKAVLSEENKA